MIAAPQSGAGKTMITLGLLRAYRGRGVAAIGAKSGPDYIDPGFHQAASGAPSVNLDAWAMTQARLSALAARREGALLLVEGAMGLFDAAADGRGASADVAAALSAPVVLVLDAARQGQTAAAIAAGLARWRRDLRVAGVILNRIGSPRHERLLRRAFAESDLPVFGAIPRLAELSTPSRHLGLVQAEERADLDAFIAAAAETMAEHVDLNALAAAAAELAPAEGRGSLVPPLGQRIAIARDAAFSFLYPHLLEDWRAAGAELSFFSPLSNDAPDAGADAVYLPGGYPELHAGRLAAAERFLTGLSAAAARGALIYGECGGYMTLGDGLVDGDGQRHAMAGLLRLETSFERRRLTLGYRRLAPRPGAPWTGPLTAHEFHYSTALREDGEPLFDATDAEGQQTSIGLCEGRVMGGYAHIIDQT